MILICISLMISHVEHPFMYLLAICIHILCVCVCGKMSIQICLSSNWIICVLLLSCRLSLLFLDIDSLSDREHENLFRQFHSCLILLLLL